MNKSEREMEYLGLLAGIARRSKADPELPPGWRGRMMAEVNELAQNRRPGNSLEQWNRAFSGVLFRFAGAACLAAIAVTVFSIIYGPDLENQAADLFMNHSGLAFYLGDVSGT